MTPRMSGARSPIRSEPLTSSPRHRPDVRSGRAAHAMKQLPKVGTMTGVALGERGVGGSVDSETVHLAAPRSSGRTVVVVGQGIDGLTIAMRVARAGYSVVGIDRRERPRPVAGAGAVTDRGRHGRGAECGPAIGPLCPDDGLREGGRLRHRNHHRPGPAFNDTRMSTPSRRGRVPGAAPAAGHGGRRRGVGHPSVVRQVVLPAPRGRQWTARRTRLHLRHRRQWAARCRRDGRRPGRHRRRRPAIGNRDRRLPPSLAVSRGGPRAALAEIHAHPGDPHAHPGDPEGRCLPCRLWCRRPR